MKINIKGDSAGDGIIFNPSLIKYSKSSFAGAYLMSYRIYKSKIHPWVSGFVAKSVLGIAFLDSNFKVKYSTEVPIEIENDLSGPEDSRIFRDSKGHIRVLFNAYSDSNLKIGENMHTIQKKELYHGMHHLMYTSRLIIKGTTIKATKAVPVCINHTTAQEKNWSPWVYRKQDFITYFTYPSFFPSKIYSVKDYSIEMCAKETKASYTNDFVKKINDYYGKGSFRFSGGTPAIPFKKGVFLAAGHIVISSNKHFKVNSKHPGKQLYVGFFYTFNPENGHFIEISYPFKLAQSITFPMGIVKAAPQETFKKKKVVVSYGSDDRSCHIEEFDLKLVKIENIDIKKFVV